MSSEGGGSQHGSKSMMMDIVDGSWENAGGMFEAR